MTEQALFLDVFSEKDQHLNVVEKPMTLIYLRKLHKISFQIRNLSLKLAEEFEFQIKHKFSCKLFKNYGKL